MAGQTDLALLGLSTDDDAGEGRNNGELRSCASDETPGNLGSYSSGGGKRLGSAGAGITVSAPGLARCHAACSGPEITGPGESWVVQGTFGA
ncbi:hypothetical protein IMZ48_25510 [Candidatus Bathyarchaeota archaeon]|nr:hypothetical protein [Candidatus Bathyarchaeota archaeon]